MDETIRINAVKQSNWSETLQGFQPEQIQQVWEVRGVDGQVVGIICESVGGKFFLNGQPDVDYASLQAAAGAIVKGET